MFSASAVILLVLSIRCGVIGLQCYCDTPGIVGQSACNSGTCTADTSYCVANSLKPACLKVYASAGGQSGAAKTCTCSDMSQVMQKINCSCNVLILMMDTQLCDAKISDIIIRIKVVIRSSSSKMKNFIRCG